MLPPMGTLRNASKKTLARGLWLLALGGCQAPCKRPTLSPPPAPVRPAPPVATAAPSAARPPTPAEIERRMLERRAAQVVVWGMPAVNYDLMLEEMLQKTAGRTNQMIYWGRPLDWHNQTLTPDPDTLSFMAFFDTRDVGPVVLEIPPASADGALNATIVNAWQEPLEDAGLYGVDKGKGIKFVLLPPGYTKKVPGGFVPLQPRTFGTYGLFRASLTSHSDADMAKAVAYGKRIKIYPLSQAAKPAPSFFTDVGDTVFDSTIRYDDTFFMNLDHVIQREPWLERDRAMIDSLRSLGVEKWHAFSPGPATKEALTEGAREARAWLTTRYDAGLPPYFDGGHWTYPAPPELLKAASLDFADPEHLPIDARGLVYHYAHIGIRRPGTGQFHLISIKDKQGQRFDGAKTYRLTVPANAPVEQHWSVTAYDRETHALIKSMPRASRASNATDLVKNADGSVDVYFGPRAPAGKEANHVPTDATRPFELVFRFYAPTQALLDKAWKLPDVELAP
jgi:hypothetical protein